MAGVECEACDTLTAGRLNIKSLLAGAPSERLVECFLKLEFRRECPETQPYCPRQLQMPVDECFSPIGTEGECPLLGKTLG